MDCRNSSGEAISFSFGKKPKEGGKNGSASCATTRRNVARLDAEAHRRRHDAPELARSGAACTSGSLETQLSSRSARALPAARHEINHKKFSESAAEQPSWIGGLKFRRPPPCIFLRVDVLSITNLSQYHSVIHDFVNDPVVLQSFAEIAFPTASEWFSE